MSEKKPTKWMVQEDCYALDSNKKECKCLSKLYCEEGDCDFYKPKNEVDWKLIENAISMYGYKYCKK